MVFIREAMPSESVDASGTASAPPNAAVPMTVLRLGHRRDRDKRITSHLGLTARAFGADRFLLAGDVDPGVLDTLTSVRERFGGDIDVRHEGSGMGWLKRFAGSDAGDGAAGVAIHLTMYGEPFRDVIPTIRRDRPVVVVVGGAKVPGQVYGICQYNVAIGHQPHSEVAALALFLDSWYLSVATPLRFDTGEVKIMPSKSGKNVITISEEE